MNGLTADVLAVLAHAVLCWRCIVLKVGTTVGELDVMMVSLGATSRVLMGLQPCANCERDTLVYRARRAGEFHD